MPHELSQLLLDERIVDAAGVERAQARQREAGGALDTALLELGLVEEEPLTALLARAADLPAGPLSIYEVVDPRARRVFPSKVAERHGLAPFSLEGRELSLVAIYPLDLGLLDEISFMLSLHLTPHVGPEWRVRSLIQRLYGGALPPRLARLAQNAGAPSASPATASPPPGPRPALPVRPPGFTGFAREAGEPMEPLAAALAQAAEAFDLSWEDEPLPPGPPLTAPPGPPAQAPAPPGPGEAAAGAPEPAGAVPAPPAPTAPPVAGRPLDRSAPPRWSMAQARAVLADATTRDEVVMAALRYARDFFQFAALFAVTRDAVAGHDALGGEDGLREVCRSVALYADDPGIFRTAIETLAPYLGPVSRRAAGSVAVLDGLGRGDPRTALVYPILLRDRPVCVLYADNGEAPVSARRLGDLLLFLSTVGGAFERIIRSRKSEPPRPAPAWPTQFDRGPPAEAPSPRVAHPPPPPEPPPPLDPGPPAADGVAAGPAVEAAVEAEAPPPVISSGLAAAPAAAQADPPATELAPPSPRSVEAGVGPAPVSPDEPAPPPIWPAASPPPAPAAASRGVPAVVGAELEEAFFSSAPGTPLERLAVHPPPPPDPLPVEPPPPEPGPGPTTRPVPSGAPDPGPVAGPVEPPRLPPGPEPAEVPSVPAAPAEAAAVVAAPPEAAPLAVEPPPAQPEPVAPAPPMAAAPAPGPAAAAVPEPAMDPAQAAEPPAGEPPRPPPAGRFPTEPGALVGAFLVSPRGSEQRSELLAAIVERADEVAPILCDQLPGPIEVAPEDLARTPAAEQGPVLAAVAALGPAAVRPLLALLNDQAPGRRRAAAALLGQAGDASAFLALAERCFDAVPEVSEAARAALALHRRDPAMKAVPQRLRRALLSGLSEQAARAARAIGALRDAESIPVLIQALEGSDATTAGASADALAAITLQRHGTFARKWLMWWKENRGRGRAEWLFGALSSEDREVRLAAATELREAAASPVAYSADLPAAEREVAARAWAMWFARGGHRI